LVYARAVVVNNHTERRRKHRTHDFIFLHSCCFCFPTTKENSTNDLMVEFNSCCFCTVVVAFVVVCSGGVGVVVVVVVVL
jgi:hypothetical protein